jgi:hypothetical protein
MSFVLKISSSHLLYAHQKISIGAFIEFAFHDTIPVADVTYLQMKRNWVYVH